jgi:hypothetical protein
MTNFNTVKPYLQHAKCGLYFYLDYPQYFPQKERLMVSFSLHAHALLHFKQFLNQVNDFHRTMYKYYTNTSHFLFVPFNFPLSALPTSQP